MRSRRFSLAQAVLWAALLCCRPATAQTDDVTIQARLARHAQVFRAFAGRAGWPRLDDLKPNANGVVDHQRNEIYDYMQRTTPATPEQELSELAARVDAIVYGTAASRYSAIDPTHTFLYSDWIVDVKTVYKNASAVQIGSQVAVTRMGGDLVLNGRRIIDRSPVFPDFAVNHSYVFFLKALPDTSSFLAISGWTFDVTGAAPALIADPRNPTGLRAFSSSSTADFFAALERSTK